MIKGRWMTEFEQIIGEDTHAGMILHYVHTHMQHVPLIGKIKALKRAALIASACEDRAHGIET